MVREQLRYLGAFRTPPEETSKINLMPTNRWDPSKDSFAYSDGPVSMDYQRQEVALFAPTRRLGRLKLVRPGLPKHREVTSVEDVNGQTKTVVRRLLDHTSVPVAPYVDGVMNDPSNQTWGEVENPDTPASVGGNRADGLLVLGDRAIVMSSVYYDATGTQDRSLFAFEYPITSTGLVTRWPFRSVAGLPEGWVAGPICFIPEKWREALKGDVLTGQPGGLPIITRQSYGPCAISLWARDVFSVADLSATLLLGYPTDKPLGAPWTPPTLPNDLFNIATFINGVTFVGDYVVFVGTHGYGPGVYGAGTSDQSKHDTTDPVDGTHYYYDPTSSAKGAHAYPYRVQAWVYHAQDLADVAAGRKRYWELVPTWFPIELPYFDGSIYQPLSAIAPDATPRHNVISADYNSERMELTIGVGLQDSVGYEPGPLFHVFGVDDVASYQNPKWTLDGTVPVPDPPPPPPPDPPPPTPSDLTLEELKALTVSMQAQIADLSATLAITQANWATAQSSLTASNAARDSALTRIAAMKTEAQMILDRNKTLKPNSRLPNWATDALNRIVTK